MSFCAISSKGSDAFATLSSVGRLSVFRRDAAAQLLVEPQGAAAAAAPTCLKLRGSVAVVGKQDGSIVSNPSTPGGYTWENAIIDNSPELSKIANSSGLNEAKKALKKFRPDLYV